ncbi:diaminobutyrate decarboxylase [Thiocystis minor]|uniref:pyridoxal phosphate-dependent decarboxylase family protein n=1 Tax=Thiocystis minor TaxID=61597 RepID=UPI001913ACE6|nr:pyridoxal-dependent decarboxylase [Thiocystis minor]MBK5967172.1 diaminobutyrate decarboxylase [Thiocystis minor]
MIRTRVTITLIHTTAHLPPPMTFRSDLDIVATALDRQVARARDRAVPVLAQQPLATLIDELRLDHFARQGGLEGEALHDFMGRYLKTVINLHHPGYLGHQVAAPHPGAALGALIDGLTNNPMAIYEMGPGAAAIEYFVINWMLEKVGWTPAPLDLERLGTAGYGGGVLTHGGSLANLTALIAARSKVRPDAWREGNRDDLALLAPGNNHYSIERAVGILGMGTRNIYPVPTDARGVMDPDALPRILAQVHADGRTPLALVANACSTAVGVHDRLRPLGEFCRAEGVWFHVDGAHGASALLSPEYRHLLDGVELADSLTWDAHKMLRTSAVCAALLVRDHRTLDSAFSQEASYLFHDKEQPGFDFLPRAVECTKSGLGLKFYLVLAALGERGLADYIERQYRLTADAYRRMSGIEDLDLPVAPESNILCFRLSGTDARQLELRRQLLAEGDFYVTSTQFQGQRYLRLVFMNPETTLEDVERLIARIRRFERDTGGTG